MHVLVHSSRQMLRGLTQMSDLQKFTSDGLKTDALCSVISGKKMQAFLTHLAVQLEG